MRKALLAAACASAMVLPTALAAQERAVDGTLGAVAGAVVAGPVGLVAGAVVGVTAGPALSRRAGAAPPSSSSPCASRGAVFAVSRAGRRKRR